MLKQAMKTLKRLKLSSGRSKDSENRSIDSSSEPDENTQPIGDDSGEDVDESNTEEVGVESKHQNIDMDDEEEEDEEEDYYLKQDEETKLTEKQQKEKEKAERAEVVRKATQYLDNLRPDKHGDYVFMDDFALRQFDETKCADIKALIYYDKDEFVKEVNKQFKKLGGIKSKNLKIGYSDFCFHFTIKNFTETPNAVAKITPKNQHKLISEYVSRNKDELAVLERWFPGSNADASYLKPAKYLDIHFYTNEELTREANLNRSAKAPISKAPFGIVAIKPQNDKNPVPTAPITYMRNALGANEGGSGEGINRKLYDEGVEYWHKFAVVKPIPLKKYRKIQARHSKC